MPRVSYTLNFPSFAGTIASAFCLLPAFDAYYSKSQLKDHCTYKALHEASLSHRLFASLYASTETSINIVQIL